MKYFSAREVSQQIDVKPVTLRAWSKALEDFGYKIFRDPQAGRMYSETDISALRRWKEYMAKNLKWEQTAKLIIEEFGDGLSSNDKAIQASSALEDTINDMQAQIDHLTEFNQELVRHLDERDRQLEETLKTIIEPFRLKLEASEEDKQRLAKESAELKRELLSSLEEQREYFRDTLQEQEKYIEESIKRRDEQLMQTLRVLESGQKEIASSVESKKRKRLFGLF